MNEGREMRAFSVMPWLGPLLPWATLVSVMVAIYAALLYAPTEATMGDVQRIFYFHMPSALVGFVAFTIVFGASILYLRTGREHWDHLAVSSAEIGVVFTAVALVTGSLWARPVWGAWWTWDPRLTTTFVLLLLYTSYLLLRAAIEDSGRRRRFAAVFGILAFADVPIVFMSIRWWRTIHPVLITPSSIEMDRDMLVALAAGTVALLLLFVQLLRLRMRLETRREELETLEMALEDG